MLATKKRKPNHQCRNNYFFSLRQAVLRHNKTTLEKHPKCLVQKNVLKSYVSFHLLLYFQPLLVSYRNMGQKEIRTWWNIDFILHITLFQISKTFVLVWQNIILDDWINYYLVDIWLNSAIIIITRGISLRNKIACWLLPTYW